MTFAESLRAATMPAHEQANHSPFITALLGGELSVDAFAALSSQLYFVYGALEEAAETMRNHPTAGQFVFDELTRIPALRQDMEFYFGPAWEKEIRPLPATEAYCARIREVAATSPEQFVAHHYTRYLGDIAGGQAIRVKLKNLHNITGPGSLFYVFDRIPSPPKFRDNYRELLNTVWTPAEQKSLILESIRAYEHNVAIFTALAGNMPAYQLSPSVD
ncbi:biliverdin-producing heme oxygenase [Actinocrispum sp. NPDC049592]|uniref:biliverdin-producing heme oxygenase n=1 Tax=Actinocrispum sp. NPDC049592 TaxID=3154835 RepID=UPI003434B767